MLDVDLIEDALAPGLLEAGYELRAQDVDLPVQQPPLVGDLVLLTSERVARSGKGSNWPPFGRGLARSKAAGP